MEEIKKIHQIEDLIGFREFYNLDKLEETAPLVLVLGQEGSGAFVERVPGLSRDFVISEFSKDLIIKSDLILLFFTSENLEEEILKDLKPFRDKVRIIFPESADISTDMHQTIGRVMWRISFLWKCPFAPKFYSRDFVDMDLNNLRSLRMTKLVTDSISRAKIVFFHAVLINFLKSKMPVLMGKKNAQANLIADLGNIFISLRNKFNLVDIPPMEFVKGRLEKMDFSEFPTISDSLLAELREIFDKESVGEKWVDPNVADYIADFESLGPGSDGKLSGNAVKKEFENSGLKSSVLFRIWRMADLDGDGFLDLFEYSLARHLIHMKLENLELPTKLPIHILSRS